MWGVHTRMLLMLELEGKIQGLQVGNRVYYPYDRLVELFGAPERSPSPAWSTAA